MDGYEDIGYDPAASGGHNLLRAVDGLGRANARRQNAANAARTGPGGQALLASVGPTFGDLAGMGQSAVLAREQMANSNAQFGQQLGLRRELGMGQMDVQRQGNEVRQSGNAAHLAELQAANTRRDAAEALRAAALEDSRQRSQKSFDQRVGSEQERVQNARTEHEFNRQKEVYTDNIRQLENNDTLLKDKIADLPKLIATQDSDNKNPTEKARLWAELGDRKSDLEKNTQALAENKANWQKHMQAGPSYAARPQPGGQPTPNAAPAGQGSESSDTIINRETGQRMHVVNGNWVPIQ